MTEHYEGIVRSEAQPTKDAVDHLYDLIDEHITAIIDGRYTAYDLAGDTATRYRGYGDPDPDIARLAVEEVENIRKEYQENRT